MTLGTFVQQGNESTAEGSTPKEREGKEEEFWKVGSKKRKSREREKPHLGGGGFPQL